MKIKTKFDIEQEVYCITDAYNAIRDSFSMVSMVKIYGVEIFKNRIFYLTDDGKFEEQDLFSTKEEAEQKLEEIENAKKR